MHLQRGWRAVVGCRSLVSCLCSWFAHRLPAMHEQSASRLEALDQLSDTEVARQVARKRILAGALDRCRRGLPHPQVPILQIFCTLRRGTEIRCVVYAMIERRRYRDERAKRNHAVVL